MDARVTGDEGEKLYLFFREHLTHPAPWLSREAGQYAFFAGWGVAVCVCEELVDEVSDAVDCGEEGLGDGDGEEEYHEGADEGLVLWGHVVAADDGCCCYGEDE